MDPARDKFISVVASGVDPDVIDGEVSELPQATAEAAGAVTAEPEIGTDATAPPCGAGGRGYCNGAAGLVGRQGDRATRRRRKRAIESVIVLASHHPCHARPSLDRTPPRRCARHRGRASADARRRTAASFPPWRRSSRSNTNREEKNHE